MPENGVIPASTHFLVKPIDVLTEKQYNIMEKRRTESAQYDVPRADTICLMERRTANEAFADQQGAA